MLHSAESFIYIRKFICKFATRCKNDLTRLSVAQVGLIDEKNQG
jgi:hypothetical protein